MSIFVVSYCSIDKPYFIANSCGHTCTEVLEKQVCSTYLNVACLNGDKLTRLKAAWYAQEFELRKASNGQCTVSPCKFQVGTWHLGYRSLVKSWQGHHHIICFALCVLDFWAAGTRVGGLA